MTSLKSSANKQSALFDFKYSLKNLIFPSIVSLLVAGFYFVFAPLSTIQNFFHGNAKLGNPQIIELIKREYAVMLTVGDRYSYVITGIMAILVGVLFAFVAFSFLMSKKKINVFFSNGVNRATIFKNRVLASMLLMALTTAIPLIADVAINTSIFGHSGYMAWHGFLLFGEYFTFMLVGFSMMSISMMLCNTIVECLFFGAGIIWLPTFLVTSFQFLCTVFLRGYGFGNFFLNDSAYWSKSALYNTAIANPLFFGKAFGNYSLGYNLFSFTHRSAIYEGPVVDTFYGYVDTYGKGYKWAQMNIIAPFLIWLAIAVLFIFVAKKLLLARKAENAGIYASQPIVSTIFTIEAAVAISSLTILSSNESDNSKALSIALWLIALFISYFVIISLCKWTVKHNKKTVVTPFATLGCLLVLVCIFSTGGFGYTTYIPDIKDVKYATISNYGTNATGNEGTQYPSITNNATDWNIFYSYNNYQLAVFSSEEDLKKLTEVNKSIAKETDNMTGNEITVSYYLKNGKIVERRFTTTDYNACYDVLSLTDTDAYRDEFEFFMSSKRKNETKSTITDIAAKENDHGKLFNYYSESEIKELLHNRQALMILSDSVTQKEIKNTDALKDAILADKTAVDYNARFRSKDKPIGEIIFYDKSYHLGETPYTEQDVTDAESYQIAQAIKFYLYESMTNTIAYLKSTGEYDLLKEAENQEIVSARVLSCKEVRAVEKEKGFASDAYSSKVFRSAVIINEQAEGLFTEYYANTEKIDNADTIKKLYNSSRSFAYTQPDDYIVWFELADGRIVTKLIYASDYQE